MAEGKGAIWGPATRRRLHTNNCDEPNITYEPLPRLKTNHAARTSLAHLLTRPCARPHHHRGRGSCRTRVLSPRARPAAAAARTGAPGAPRRARCVRTRRALCPRHPTATGHGAGAGPRPAAPLEAPGV
jgi:hypothetical protein